MQVADQDDHGHCHDSASGPGARAPLADLKTIKNAFGGTVNDVVLACVAGALRGLLCRRGEPPSAALTVRTLVPVSVRTPDARGVLDNRVSALVAELPVGLEDPVARPHALTTQLNDRKRSGQALAGAQLTQLAGLCPAPLLSLGTRAFARLPQRQIQTVTTNVPGPQHPLYLCRRRMLEIFPYVPLALHVALGIAICSYPQRTSRSRPRRAGRHWLSTTRLTASINNTRLKPLRGHLRRRRQKVRKQYRLRLVKCRAGHDQRPRA